jgi:transcriptional regulator with XRE-family HTH domain
MEHEMKISAALVRRLRNARGWSQDQLATASGLSLRTIQRVEAEGVASMGTRVSLAATFSIPLAELADAPDAPPAIGPALAATANPSRAYILLFAGLAILSCALVVESGRLAFAPGANDHGLFLVGTMQLALEAVLVAIGAVLAIPATISLWRQRRAIGVAIAVVAMPMAVLMSVGLVFALLRGRAPSGSLLLFGGGGLLLLAMVLRDARRPLRG